MDRGDSSVFQAMITQRLAGYNESVVAHVCREIARSVSELHKSNLVHSDLKLRNILVSNEEGNGCEVNEDSRVVLCDLDASGTMLDQVEQQVSRPRPKKQWLLRSGSCEVARVTETGT